jgi:NAD(P)-dependent dehydrogenase (short-subunit alcohol dehydrogenase family)
VITGAAGGIGSELVERFLRNGETVVGCDLDGDVLARWRRRWDDGEDTEHPRLTVVAADVSSEKDCEALALAAGESVDVLVNCAGWFPLLPFDEMTVEQWRRVVDVNLTGTYLVTRALLPAMKKSSAGRIINFGSGSMFDGTAVQSPYVAAKSGVMGFTRALAREVGQYGITANLVTPGLTLTSAVTDIFGEEIIATQRETRALARDEVATDLVGPVFFLASDDAAFVTGQVLNVDGGQHLH